MERKGSDREENREGREKKGGKGRQTLREEASGSSVRVRLTPVPCLQHLPGKQSAPGQMLCCVCYTV